MKRVRPSLPKLDETNPTVETLELVIRTASGSFETLVRMPLTASMEDKEKALKTWLEMAQWAMRANVSECNVIIKDSKEGENNE